MVALVLTGIYLAMIASWALLTLRLWWQRRRAIADLHGPPPPPALGIYEMARLAGDRYRQIEVMMATLLENGVLEPGEQWGAPEKWSNGRTWRLKVCGELDRDAHELERRFVEATRRAPDKSALGLASDVVDGDVGDHIDAPLISAGLLYDDSGRWRLWRFGAALLVLGFGGALVRALSCCAPDDITDVLAISSLSMFLPLLWSMPDTADVTPNGRAVVEHERQRYAQLRHSTERIQLPLAIALHGTHIIDEHERGSAGPDDAAGMRRAYQGARYGQELLASESERSYRRLERRRTRPPRSSRGASSSYAARPAIIRGDKPRHVILTITVVGRAWSAGDLGERQFPRRRPARLGRFGDGIDQR